MSFDEKKLIRIKKITPADDDDLDDIDSGKDKKATANRTPLRSSGPMAFDESRLIKTKKTTPTPVDEDLDDEYIDSGKNKDANTHRTPLRASGSMAFDENKLIKVKPITLHISDDADEDDEGGDSGGDVTDRTPFRKSNYKVQGELVKGERGFGEVSIEGRVTEPPPEEALESNYTEENEFAVSVGNEIEAHPLLDCQAFDGRDPKRDNVKPTGEDILDYARNNPEARLTLQPSLKLALENAERYRYSRSTTPTLKPTGM